MSIEFSTKQLISDSITDIYGRQNIDAAFITGSIAAGSERPDSDIDIVVCHVDELDSAEYRRSQFTEFYFDLHQQLNREPDNISPGEILPYGTLSDSLDRISAVEPTSTLQQRDDFDAICWAGMLASKKELLVPFSSRAQSLHKLARFVTYSWASSLYPGKQMTEETGRNTDIDKWLRRSVSCPGYYDAH